MAERTLDADANLLETTLDEHLLSDLAVFNVLQEAVHPGAVDYYKRRDKFKWGK